MRSKTVREYLRSHVLGLVAIFIALTGTAIAGGGAGSGGDGDGPKASASAVTVKKVNRKLARALQRIAALEAKPAPNIPTIPTTLPPSGPAGGVLDGSYPNPGLATDSVGATEIIDSNVGTAEIAPGAITGAKFFFSGFVFANLDAVAGEACISGPSITAAGIDGDDIVVVSPPVGFPTHFTLTGVPDPGSNQVDFQICNHFIGGGSADPDGTGGAYKVLVIKQP